MRARSTTSARCCRVTTGGVIDSEASCSQRFAWGVRYTKRSASRDFLRRRGTEVVVTGAPRKRLVPQGARGFESHPLRQPSLAFGELRLGKPALRTAGHAKAVAP